MSKHHQHQHPEQDGQHAQQMGRLQVGVHASTDQAPAAYRTGTDIAIHHPERPRMSAARDDLAHGWHAPGRWMNLDRA